MEYGADLRRKDSFGDSPLQSARKSEESDFVALFKAKHRRRKPKFKPRPPPQAEGPPPKDVPQWEREHWRLWEELVPERGQAKTVQGEVIRCTGCLQYEALNNGNMNWERGFEDLARHLEALLADPKTFKAKDIKTIKAAVAKLIREYDRPSMDDYGTPHAVLKEMAVRFCQANPKPIPHKKNRKLTR